MSGHEHEADTRRRTHSDEHGTRDVETCACGAFRTACRSLDYVPGTSNPTVYTAWARPESERAS